MIDWEQKKKLDQYFTENNPEAFDSSPSGDSLWNVEFNPDLAKMSIEAQKDAEYWSIHQWGNWLVTGAAGSGKGGLINMIAYKMKF